jgi:hypothetical protein
MMIGVSLCTDQQALSLSEHPQLCQTAKTEPTCALGGYIVYKLQDDTRLRLFTQHSQSAGLAAFCSAELREAAQ